MLLGRRTNLQTAARRGLAALVVFVSLLLPVASMAARQAADWAGGTNCGMACCKRTGHCCCRMPKPATPSGLALATPRCPAGCGASVQAGQSGSDLFRPAERPCAVFVAAASPLPMREAGRHTSSWKVPSLWQRPPPAFLS
jgi:hypothetical protein